MQKMFHMEQNQTIMWYKKWFDTEYYHLLYANRNEEEAHRFIKNIHNTLHLPEKSMVWDSACGKGRHCYVFHKLGYHVTGTDISPNNIRAAKENYKELADNFFLHDMRREFYQNYFDLVLNLFTSIGYFDYLYEEQKAIHILCKACKTNGYIIIDFLNPDYLTTKIVPHETKEINRIVFNIKREIKDGFVFKHIEVIDKNNKYHFQERVRLLSFSFIEKELHKNNVKLVHTFGDYNLSEFNPKTSPRMIFIGKRIT